MTYLPNIIKKIDDFFRLASAFETIKRVAADPEEDDFEEPEPDYSQYDDPRFQKVNKEEGAGESDESSGPGLYPNIINIASSIDKTNEDVAAELLLIAAIYKRAVEINGGYNYVKRILSTALNSIDDLVGGDMPDEEENPILSEAENLINMISADIIQRAKTSPNQMNDAQAERELKEVKSTFNQAEAREEMETQKSVMERGPKDKPGVHGVGPVGPLETPQKYLNEIIRLKDGLENDPSISLDVAPSERSINQNIRSHMENLIGVLSELVKKLPEVLDLEGKVKDAPDDPETKEAFIKAAQELSQLRAQRRDLEQRVRKYILAKEMEDLEKQFVLARDPRHKKWIGEKIALQRVRLSNDYNKNPEIKARKSLIKATGTFDDAGENFIPLSPPPEMLQRLQDEIKAAEDVKIDKKKYDEIQSRQRAKSHGQTSEYQTRRKGRRGGGSLRARLHQYDIGAATFHGLVDKLGEKINTATHVSRLAVTQIKEKGKAKTHNALKPYVDALSKAIQKKDNKAKYDAIKALKAQLVDWSHKAPEIRALEKNVRLLPFFKKYEAELDLIAKWKKGNEPWNLDEAQRNYIKQVLESWDNLLRIYGRYYQGIKAPAGVTQLDLNYGKAVEYISAVLNRLEYETDIYAERAEPQEQLRVEPTEKLRVEPREPEYLEEAEESEPQKRMLKLEQLMGVK